MKFRDDNLGQTKAGFGYKYKMNGNDEEDNNDGNEDDDNVKIIIPKYKHSYREQC